MKKSLSNKKREKWFNKNMRKRLFFVFLLAQRERELWGLTTQAQRDGPEFGSMEQRDGFNTDLGLFLFKSRYYGE